MEHRLETVKKRIDILLANMDSVIIAIDGPCTSGKTTLAEQLSQLYNCNVFHMDDFFLRPEQRTPERFAEIGGNIDYERFAQEVLSPLTACIPFSYRPFDCSSFTLGQPKEVIPKNLNIIEGTYSHHPYFGNPYDLKVLLTITPQLQRERILQRPEFLHQRFFQQWIPMENKYFEQLSRDASIIL